MMHGSSRGKPLLDWTGHILIDVGIAGVCAMSRKSDPADITVTDLENCAAELDLRYTKAFFKQLHSVFFNAGYHNGGPATRRAHIGQFLYGFRKPQIPGVRCFFSKAPAQAIIDRTGFPLLAAAGCLSYGPMRGVPINGAYLTASQTLALSCTFVGGRTCWVYTEDPDLLIEVTSRRIDAGRRMAAAGALMGAPTEYVKDSSIFHELMSVIDLIRKPDSASPVVFYLAGNSREPSLERFYYPTSLIRFLMMVKRNAELESAWNKLTHVYDLAPKPGKSSRKANLLWNRLNRVSRGEVLDRDAVAQLIRLVTSTSSPEIAREKWILSSHFLKEVYGLKQKKIEIVRRIADRMAELVVRSGKKGFFQQFRGAVRPDKFLGLLTQVHTQEVKDGSAPPFSFDDAVDMLGGGDLNELYLIRRLFMIRLVDQLFAMGYFQSEEAKQELAELAGDVEQPEQEAVLEEV